ncbi:6-phosphogluconolactonase [Conexibacter sp. DBS9H8]|uniref:6-phosphogluconolactonase n=1 Tax=Conexibacter sp. DBS9H8 TaxID=2937801 RepID=UPI00200DE7D2|nr:6-phosphogluconolactonase [Conexibacter sp. DBS9H8]
MSADIRIVDDPRAECAAIVGAALGDGPVVLTGGSTVPAYAKVAAEVWKGAQLWFSDERCVPTSDERSNYGALEAAVGGHISGATVERVRGEDGHAAAAEDYERRLVAAGIPERGFSLFVIGLGPDAHICSMFPGQAAVGERQRLCVGVPEAGREPFVPRVTLTLPAVALARHVLVMAAGGAKADALARAFAEDAPVTEDVPGSLLGDFAQRLTVLTDEAGAARL